MTSTPAAQACRAWGWKTSVPLHRRSRPYDPDLPPRRFRSRFRLRRVAQLKGSAINLDQIPADLMSQIRKSKALDWLIHHVEIVDLDSLEFLSA